jgi:hypothetical protein
MKKKTLICVDCLRRPVCIAYSELLQPTGKGRCSHHLQNKKPPHSERGGDSSLVTD